MSHTLAIGTQCGNVHLYSIHADLSYVKLRTLSLAEWGYTGRASGFVEALRWTEDSKALAVLWDKALKKDDDYIGAVEFLVNVSAGGKRTPAEEASFSRA